MYDGRTVGTVTYNYSGRESVIRRRLRAGRSSVPTGAIMDHRDYASLARDADAKADRTKSRDIAEGYRELAKTYRALAAQLERMTHRDPRQWADYAATKERQDLAGQET